MARSSCSQGSSGNVAAGLALDDGAELGHQLAQVRRCQLGVLLDAALRLLGVERVVERSGRSTSMTMRPNIWMKRR